MARFLLALLLIQAFFSFSCPYTSKQPVNPATRDTISGKVVRIIDGDTFELLTAAQVNERIRLHGIDCPERSQPFSRKAKDHLEALVAGKTVSIIRMDKDRYNRTIAMVYIGTTNVNESMLRAGYAWHFRRYDQNPRWQELELEARTNRRGLWAEPSPMAPWDWRAKNR